MATNDAAASKQIEYLMALFGMVRRDDGVHQILNGDEKDDVCTEYDAACFLLPFPRTERY